MSKQLLTSYTFTPGAANAGTVVVPGTYTLEQFLLITNVTSGTILYQFNVPSKGAVRTTGGGNTTLTLEFSTQSMSSADRLQIFIDDLTSPGGGGSSGGLTDAQLRATPVPVSDAGGSVTVDGSVSIAGTAAVSAASLPLPSGAATAANQATEIASLGNIDADLGAPADAAATSDTGTFGVIALIKRGLTNWTTLLGRVPSLTVSSTRLLVDGSGVTQPVSGPLTDTQLRATAVPVSGTFYQATQPISGSVSITGTAAVSGPLTDTQLRATAVPVSGTFYQATQPISGSVSITGTAAVSAASLPLPTGAATAAKQPALGAAGTPSADVLTVQGATSMTALKVDGSGVTQPVSGSVSISGTAAVSGPLTDTQLRATAVPVSGTFYQATQPISGTITANAGTNLNTSALALETGGNLASISAKLPTLSLGAQAQSAALAVSPANKLTVTGPAAQSTLNVDLITGNVNGWYDAAGYNYASFTIIANAGISAGAITIEQTNDLTNDSAGTNAVSFNDGSYAANNASAGVTTLAASTIYRRGAYLTNRYLRVRISTALTGGTVQCVVVFSNMPPLNPSVGQKTDISFVAGTTAVAAGSLNGSATSALGIFSVAGISNTDYSAQNVAAASGSLTVLVNSANAPCLTFDVNLTAFTAGSSTGLDLYLQESPDNGTTYYDIWQVEALTATGRARIPALPVSGRRRIRWVNRTGAATTATLTVTSMGTPAALPIQRQFFDRTSGVGSGTAVATTNSAAYDIAGCKQFTVVMQAGTATAVGSFQAQMSMDGTNWYNASAATAIGATTANNTIIPITSGLTGRFIRVTCTAAGTTQVINAIHIYGTN